MLHAMILLGLSVSELPSGFVYLSDVAPTVLQDMRYAGSHNFVGRPIRGYAGDRCILTRQAATALARVQEEVLEFGLSLKVYDCYRPQKAVDDFVAWSRQPDSRLTREEFYPTLEKEEIFPAGYVAARSGHTRGSTVDLTLVVLPAASQPTFSVENQVACFAPQAQRFADNSLDFGTGYDCFEARAHTLSALIEPLARQRRLLLRAVLEKHGFANYPKEWWHFSLREEPFSDTYFDFDVR